MVFGRPFLISEINGAYAVRRCLLESVSGGSDYFVTEGSVIKGKTPDGRIAIQNSKAFEGWRHDCSSDNELVTFGEKEVSYESGNEYQP